MPDGRSFFDDSPALAVFTNGVLIVDDNGSPRWTEKHSPDHRARNRFEFAYEPGLTPKHTVDVMHDWFAGLEPAEVELRILALRQYAGHTLLGSLRRKKLSAALMLVGNGHDGKSTFLGLVSKCLPPGSTCALDPAALGSKSACVDMTRAALHGKMANICPDCSAEQWHDTSFLKRVLDHEPVTARRQGQDPFTWRPTIASLFACNTLPSVSDKSWGFFRRWLLVGFPNRVPMHKRDARLESKLLGLEKRELTCWFIDAALQQLGSDEPCWFAEPACHLELRTQWAASGDSVSAFIGEYTVDAGPNKSEWTATAVLHRQYEAWCKWAYGPFRAGRETVGLCAFAKALSRMPGVARGQRPGAARTRVINRVVRQ
jgi:putative DNA primase/helicase